MQWFQQLRIGVKLILAFLVVAALGAVVSAVGIFQMSRINASTSPRCPTRTPLIARIPIVHSFPVDATARSAPYRRPARRAPHVPAGQAARLRSSP